MRHLRWYIKYPLAVIEAILLMMLGCLEDFEFSALPIIMTAIVVVAGITYILEEYW